MQTTLTRGTALRIALWTVPLLGAFLFIASCPRPFDVSGIDDPESLDDYHLDLPYLETEEWVDQYRPEASWDGVNLMLYRRRIPMLLDCNGRLLHSWPLVRSVGRALLNGDGSVAVIGRDNLIKEYDWNGELRWYYRMPSPADFPHHDFQRTSKGHYLIIVRDGASGMDHLHEADRRGRLVWLWRAEDHLDEHFPDWRSTSHADNDPVHMNSVQELPPNPLYAAGDQRFRPGNVLVSARNLNSLFIIDRKTDAIVWTYSGDLDFQHEATMIPDGFPDAGMISVFNNGYMNRDAYRQSRVQLIDPSRREVIWQYRHPGFYSSVAGVQQALPNGNFLVTSSESGRVFELTRDREIVWEWVPPYLPMRATRYPWNHCPQMKTLDRKPPEEVEPIRNWAFIDMELYALTIPEEQLHRRLGGSLQKLVPKKDFCRRLWIPPSPRIEFDFGLDRELLGDHRLTAHFLSTMRSEKDGETRVLVDEVISSDDEALWREIRHPLPGFDFERVEFCVHTTIESDLPADEAAEIAIWIKPRIRTNKVRTYSIPRPEQAQSKAEEALELQQLEALGYVQ